MAKKSFTTSTDFLSDLDDLAPKKPAANSRKTFTEQAGGPSARDIALATGEKSMAGQYKRKQILIPPAQLNYIREKAREVGLSQAALFRWLIDYGLNALDNGITPDVEIVEVRGEARLSHWSSKS